jgi:glycolate dehydrogenase iron-sulfur subunit
MMEYSDSDRSSAEDASKRLIEESNRCVSCGLCLPHCPTYRLLQSEADSPRGRIALINGVATNRIPLNKKFIQHLDRCLTCRACESVCPNNVAYGYLADEARRMIRISAASRKQAQQTDELQSQLLPALQSAWITRPARLERLRSWLYLFQKTGAIRLFQKLNFWNRKLVDRILMQLPPVVYPCPETKKKRFFPLTWQSFYPAAGMEKGKVGLFLGCIARITDAETLNAAIFVLNRIGYSVCIPAGQTCCGALYQHAGEPEKAEQLMQQNRQAFSGTGVQTIITTASGCGVQLKESDTNGTVISDISKFLMSAADWDTITIKPLAKTIAVHDPCSLRHVLDDAVYPYQLLKHIPDARVVLLADNDQCCGAAGTYFVRQPTLADRLLDGKIKALDQSGAQLLATSNVGCAMHIASRLRATGSVVEVLHPVTLLARQMGMQ